MIIKRASDEQMKELIQLALDDNLNGTQEWYLYYNLGLCRNFISKNITKRIKELAKNNHPEALWLYGVCKAISTNGFKYIEKSQQLGSIRGSYWSNRLVIRNTYILQQCVKHMNPSALFRYGEGIYHMHHSLREIHQDLLSEQRTTLALTYFVKAAELGNLDAMYMLSTLYEKKPETHSLAGKWLRRVNTIGNPYGYMVGVPMNMKYHTIPWSEWKPKADLHKWLSDEQKDAVFLLLCSHRCRTESLFALLPKDILYMVIEYIITR